MTFAGPALKKFGSFRGMRLALANDEEARRAEPYKGDLGKVGLAAIYNAINLAPHSEEDEQQSLELQNISEIDLEYAETIEQITLLRGKRQIILQTGNMMPPFQALNVCTSDLVREWGLDPEQHRSYLARPKWLNERVIARRIQRTYPSEALRQRESGIIRMRVIVEQDGTVSDCYLQYATKVDHLESPACRQMRSARFEPALDSEGAPMRSFFMTSIFYSISS